MTRRTAHTVHESFPSHGSSVAGPCHGDLPRASATEAVHARSEAGKLGVGSLQAPRSGSRWGGDPHSYRDVSVGLMTCSLRLAPLPASHRGPRRPIPAITAGLSLLGPSHHSPGLRFGTSPCSVRTRAESPRVVTTFLMLVLCSRRVALSAGLEVGEWPVGSRSAGPQSPSLLGRRGRAAVPARDTPFSPVGDDDGSVVRSWSTPSCSAPGSTPLGSERSPVFAPLRGSAASLYRGGDAFH
jgi:hypothetical protein